MSITDELRKWISTVTWLDDGMSHSHKNILAIADRIDAEHQKAEDEWRAKNGDMWLEGYNVCHKELTEGHPVIVADLEKAGWVKSPVDSDGVPIHVGDVMEWIDLDGEVTVTCSVDAVGVDCFFAWDKGNGRYAQKCANAYRHYHEPTVEDVLRELLDEAEHFHSLEEEREAIAEYAAKLRLAGSDAE